MRSNRERGANSASRGPTARTLAHVAFVTEQGIALQRGETYFEVVDSDDDDFFWTARRFASGVLSLEDAARLAGATPDELEAGFEALIEGGLAYRPSTPPPTMIESGRFLKVVQQYGDMWRAHLLRDPIFHPPTPAPLTWLGFLIENWHRAAALPAIVAAAHASAKADTPEAVALARLAAEEDDHAHYYAEALAALPAPAKSLLENSAPLLSTRALNWFLAEIAALRPLSILGIGRLTETEAGDEQHFDDEARSLARAYDVPMAAIAPVLAHGQLDACASHKLVIDEVIGMRDAWPIEVVEGLLQDMHDFRHAYGGFLAGIRDHYGGKSDSIPNRIFRWNDFSS
jgi:hypothetical protein